MTASPTKANGSTRPRTPLQFADWRIESTPASVEEQHTSKSQAEPTETPELVAQAQADAIRAQAWADAEKQRLAFEAEKEAALKLADAEAEAVRVRAEEEARRLRLANDRQERKAREDEAASEARIAESNRKRDDAIRAGQEASEQARRAKTEQAEAAKEVADADEKWRKYAIRFAIVCAIVALPVQMNAFWNREAPWLIAAPIMLEGAAWVVHRGARAAVANGRPVWHYRTIVWLFALIAAAINLFHGIAEFDLGTAIGTAFASVAGPGVWDLHEHGRLRKRDGVSTRRERKAAKKEAKRLAVEKAENELREAERQAYLEKAAREAAEKLDAMRREQFPKVHAHAWKLVADYGETGITPAIWKQAKLDVEGAPPGESADVIRMRNAAEMRVEAAREKRSVNGSTQQVASQVLGTKKPRVYNPPARRGVRTAGDAPKQSPGARRQASIAAKSARQKDQ